MKRNTIYIVILMFPFLIMILINEIVRAKIIEKPYVYQGITSINSSAKNSDRCTWICHNNTTFCKVKHVKYLKPYYRHTDVMYFGVINALKGTGSYQLANIIFLIILLPGFIWLFLIKAINIQSIINKSK